jgi:5-formyltetrahydrofolate cyclo-ligase
LAVRENQSRQQLRQFYRQRRNSLSPTQQLQAGHQLLKTCLQTSLLKTPNRIACYLPNDGEIDLFPLINYCWQNNKQIYLPVLHPFVKGHLLFVAYYAQSKMLANRFGIPEPEISCPEVCPINQLDVIFTPLVAFDKLGQRLGMGGGFYDRTLAPLQREKTDTQVIGVAHSCQLAKTSLNCEKWDIPMQKIITPGNVFNCKE